MKPFLQLNMITVYQSDKSNPRDSHFKAEDLHGTYQYLQSNQVKRTPQDSINELIISEMNPLVVPVTGVKFKAAFLHG